MLGLLARVIIGIVVAGAVGTAGYAVYKLITRDSVKEEVNAKLADEDEDIIKRAFAAKVKEKKSEGIKVDIMDEWDEPITEMDITGDEISDEIQVGDVILL